MPPRRRWRRIRAADRGVSCVDSFDRDVASGPLAEAVEPIRRDREAKYKRACDRAFRHGKPAPPRPVRKPPPDNWKMFIKDDELRANMRAAAHAL
jgi:hypothetical protein